jgi:hypothetical protein
MKNGNRWIGMSYLSNRKQIRMKLCITFLGILIIVVYGCRKNPTPVKPPMVTLDPVVKDYFDNCKNGSKYYYINTLKNETISTVKNNYSLAQDINYNPNAPNEQVITYNCEFPGKYKLFFDIQALRKSDSSALTIGTPVSTVGLFYLVKGKPIRNLNIVSNIGELIDSMTIQRKQYTDVFKFYGYQNTQLYFSKNEGLIKIKRDAGTGSEQYSFNYEFIKIKL